MEKHITLQRIENDRRIMEETDGAFLYALECALLLALKERGRLTEPQLRAAERKLREQQRIDPSKPRSGEREIR